MTQAEEKFLNELDIKIAGNSLNPDRTNFKAGDLLEARVSDEAFSEYGGFYVIRTPLADYMPDHDAIPQRNGEVVDLGVIPTLAYSNVQRAEFPLESDSLYDLWYVHGSKFDPARITTGQDTTPHRLTLDEVQLMVILRAGFKPEDVEGINATVIHDGNQLRNRTEFLYYGFQVGEVVASISTQRVFGMHYAKRTGDLQKDFFAEANSNTLAAEICKLKSS